MLRLHRIRVPGCLAFVVPAFLACGGPSSAPPAAPPLGPEPPDAADAAPGDARPAEPADSAAVPVPEVAPPTREAAAPADATTAPDVDARAAATCRTHGAAVLPRCAANPRAEGCPLELPATAALSIDVLRFEGYDDLGNRAFADQVPLLLMCFGEALAGAPDAPVVVELTLDVAPTGCAAVRRAAGDWPTRRMHDCVRGVLEQLALPVPDASGGASLVLRLEFVH